MDQQDGIYTVKRDSENILSVLRRPVPYHQKLWRTRREYEDILVAEAFLCRRKLAKLVADHVLCYGDGYVVLAVVYHETDPGGEKGHVQQPLF